MSIKEEDSSNQLWTHDWKKLLLDCRLDAELEFKAKRKKPVDLWGRVLQQIREKDASFPFSRNDISRKFLNLMVTYKRIKKRNAIAGEVATTWEYFDQIDQVYGYHHEKSDIENILEFSLSPPNADSASETNDPIEEATSRAPPPRKRAGGDVLDFIQRECANDKKILKAILDCEKEKVKLEREKLKEMKKLRETLQALIQRKHVFKNVNSAAKV